jgi:hypothetical protein
MNWSASAKGEVLITLQQAALELGGAKIKTLVRHLAKAGIKGRKLGRRRLLSPAEMELFKAYLAERTPPLTREQPPMVATGNVLPPSPDVARTIHRAETARLTRGVWRGQVTGLDLERERRSRR